MYCSKCGKEISENSKFCSYCGSNNNIEITKNSNKKINNIMGWIIAILLVIAAVCCIGYLINSSHQENEETKAEIREQAKPSVKFNCPNCKKRLNVKVEQLYHLSNSYIYGCPNCGKTLTMSGDLKKVYIEEYY